MENRLFDYMNRRIHGSYTPSIKTHEGGPLITISRQTGCGASDIAWALCEELNKKIPAQVKENRWNFISREILLKSAEELHLDPIALEHVLSDKNRGIMDQIVEALSTHSHKSDQKILKTVESVIRQFGNKGHVVIVGRGGAWICKDVKRSLHIRLEAPEEWRIDEIVRRLDFSRDFAAEYVKKHDAERELLVTKLYGEKHSSLMYDVKLNRVSFSDKEIVETILKIGAINGVI